jgi:SAM-dependent methyltransferase
MAKTVKNIFQESFKDISKLYDNLEVDDEFEAIFYNTNRFGRKEFYMIEEDFTNVLSNLALLDGNTQSTSLHIIYSPDRSLKYRVEIDSIDEVIKYSTLLKNRNKNVVFRSLLDIVNDSPNVNLIKKSISADDILDEDKYGVRFRKSKEESKITKEEMNMLENISFMEGNEISYRLRDRVSHTIVDDKNASIEVDMTYVRTSNYLDKLPHSEGQYEIEIDLQKKNKKANGKYLDMFIAKIEYLLKIIQQSNHLISSNEYTILLDTYKKLLYGKVQIPTPDRLRARNSYSINIKALLNNLPNRYMVTDKADGERYFLIIDNGIVSVLSNNMKAKRTGYKTKNDFSNTILDGEYIFIKSAGKYIYMAFDILFYKGEDCRDMRLTKRLELLNDVMASCFDYDFKFEMFGGSGSMDNVIKFYDSQIRNYLAELNDYIKKGSGFLIRRKMILLPKGVHNNEIYAYSTLINEIYPDECPYLLDGLIYTPIEESYNPSSSNREYKWKPQDKLTIDFYIKLEREAKTNKIIAVYDNSDLKNEESFYNICNLNVSRRIGKMENAVPFMKEVEQDTTHLPLVNGHIYDDEGYIVKDNTVVEFSYDISRPPKKRWIPMRTRHDKTRYMLLNKRKYGNNEEIAIDNWNQIHSPIHASDLSILGDVKTYEKHRYNMDNSQKVFEGDKNVYYQHSDNILVPLRDFHNWIKTNLISIYCKPVVKNGKVIPKNVLDIAVGQGGDLGKYFHAGVGLLVGLDVDKNGLEKKGGAVDRYNVMKKNWRPSYYVNNSVVVDYLKKNKTEMQFIQADARNYLESAYQNKSLPNLDYKYDKLIRRYFDKKFQFDVVNCQFAIHYFFENQETTNRFMKNVNDHLKENGYFIFTTFDAGKIFELLDGKDTHAFNYIDDAGNSNKLFEIKKSYTEKKLEEITVGSAIEVYNSIISENYVREYLVNKDYIIEHLKNKYGLFCIETELFSTLRTINESFFKRMANSNIKGKKYFENIEKFYSSDSPIDRQGVKFSSLSRYYIFKKMTPVIQKKVIVV